MREAPSETLGGSRPKPTLQQGIACPPPIRSNCGPSSTGARRVREDRPGPAGPRQRHGGARHLQPPLAESDDRTRSAVRSEEHTSELQSRQYLVCRLLLEK